MSGVSPETNVKAALSFDDIHAIKSVLGSITHAHQVLQPEGVTYQALRHALSGTQVPVRIARAIESAWRDWSATHLVAYRFGCRMNPLPTDDSTQRILTEYINRRAVVLCKQAQEVGFFEDWLAGERLPDGTPLAHTGMPKERRRLASKKVRLTIEAAERGVDMKEMATFDMMRYLGLLADYDGPLTVTDHDLALKDVKRDQS